MITLVQTSRDASGPDTDTSNGVAQNFVAQRILSELITFKLIEVAVEMPHLIRTVDNVLEITFHGIRWRSHSKT